MASSPRGDGLTRIDVACSAEGPQYMAHSAAMLHSLIARNGGSDVHIHYLHGPDFPGEGPGAIAEMVEREGASVSFREIPDDWLDGLPVEGFGRRATWYRVFLPDLLPGVERVLYLDVDLVVLDSVAPLWDIDLSGNWIAAVTNVLQHDHFHRPAELGLAGPEVYFNAGVLLMNLEEMRRDRCTAALLEYSVEHAEWLAWQDQDAINVVLGERRLMLEPRWNCMSSFFLFPWAEEAFGPDALAEALRAPAIRHFEGPAQGKPWHFLCEREMAGLYAEHRRRTPWPSFTPEGATFANRLRRLRRRGSPRRPARRGG